jgi:hypothetical protein
MRLIHKSIVLTYQNPYLTLLATGYYPNQIPHGYHPPTATPNVVPVYNTAPLPNQYYATPAYPARPNTTSTGVRAESNPLDGIILIMFLLTFFSTFRQKGRSCGKYSSSSDDTSPYGPTNGHANNPRSNQ